MTGVAGLFFTGTDTGVGKTFVTAAVARLLRGQGRPVRVCKPVATGARQVDGRWISDDTLTLAEAAGAAGEWERLTPWTFPEPAAPPVAARAAGQQLALADLAGAVRRQAQPGAALLVEGVGGLLCPLTETETVADLAAELGLPLVVVARRSLGTLNHTLLTLEVARGRGLPVAGVVVSETARPEGLAEETNVEELRRRIAVPLLAVVPHGEPAAVAAVDWWALGERRG
ncbi:MAG TPA: dethiobiotin synthase [Gemmataceae bacterium]|nr:dethiobiotin synthase [Gemmataceae bacterium]